MKLQKRVKQIVSLTLDDCISAGVNFTEPKKEMVEWIVKELLKNVDTEDLTTAELSAKVLSMIECLEIMDLGFIIELLADDEALQPSKEPSFGGVTKTATPTKEPNLGCVQNS